MAAVPRAAGTIAPRSWKSPSVSAGGAENTGHRRRISRDVELLELDAHLAHRRDVVVGPDHAVGREQVEPADHGDQRLARLGLEPRPVVVRLLGQPHVGGRVVAVPQDPRGVVGGAAAVPELELLEPHHRVAACGEVPGRGRAERAEPDRRRSRRPPLVEEVSLARQRPSRQPDRRGSRLTTRPSVVSTGSTERDRAAAAASGGCRRSRPPSARTTRGCRRATTCRAAPTRRSPSPGG